MKASPIRRNDFTHVPSCLLFRDVKARAGEWVMWVTPGPREEPQASVSYHSLRPTWSSVHIWTCKNKQHFHLFFFSFINAGSSCVSKQSIYVSLKWLARPIEQTNENKQMYWPLSQWLSEASVLICSWTQTKKGLIWMKDSCILYVYFHSNKCSCLPSVFSSHSIIPITPRQHLSCC